MSYAWEFADTGLDDLRRLDVWLQEKALDELDRLASSLSGRRGLGDQVHDFVRERGSASYYVFIVYVDDAAARTLRIKTIGLYVRPRTQ